MGLRGDRQQLHDDISFFATATATRGGVVSASTAGSGAAMDQAAAVVAYKANPSGAQPLGILLNTVVNEDLTRMHRNWHKDEVQVNSKVTVLMKGTVVTDMIYTGHTPAVGGYAYVGHSGYIAASDVATDHVNAARTRVIGVFLSTKDEDGFCKVSVNLPNNP